MNSVTVKKDELLEKVRDNRRSHMSVYRQAHSRWKEAVEDGLGKAYERAVTGEEYVTHLNLPEPQHHEDDYVRVISMLKMSVEDTITLSDADYRQFVLDQWGWKGTFTSTNSFYSS